MDDILRMIISSLSFFSIVLISLIGIFIISNILVLIFLRYYKPYKLLSLKIFGNEPSDNQNIYHYGYYARYIKYVINHFSELNNRVRNRSSTSPFQNSQECDTGGNDKCIKQTIKVVPKILDNLSSQETNSFHVANSSTAKEGESTKREGNHRTRTFVLICTHSASHLKNIPPADN